MDGSVHHAHARFRSGLRAKHANSCSKLSANAAMSGGNDFAHNLGPHSKLSCLLSEDSALMPCLPCNVGSSEPFKLSIQGRRA